MKQAVPIVKYPLDLTAKNPDNLVKNELHSIGPEKGRTFSTNHGPFYVDSVIITESSTGKVLTKSTDYMILQPYQDATMRTGKEVAAIIYITNKKVQDELKITYQVVGGEYSWSVWAIKKLIEELDLDNRPVHWLDVVGKPIYFPPTPHLHPLSDTYGWEYIGYMLDQIALAITNGDIGAREEMMRRIQLMIDDLQAQINSNKKNHSDHLKDYSNPHKVTKAQVGLGNLENYVPLTTAQATALGNLADTSTHTQGYIRSTDLVLANKQLIAKEVTPHINNKNNPHSVTKAQVGLGSVLNYTVATKDEAIGGVLNDRYMTPLRVAEAIKSQVGDELDAHTNDKTNPHAVTKAQVGLGSVLNYGIATKAEAEAGTSNVKYMTPLRVAEAISKQAVTLLQAHIDDKGNPHKVTKDQVGLGNLSNHLDLTDQQSTAAGNIDNLAGMAAGYMTPRNYAFAAKETIRLKVQPHLDDKANPHSVTKAQVGLGSVQNYGVATSAEAIAGTVNNKYVTPLRVAEAIREQAGKLLKAHIDDKNNPHAVTKAQVGLGNIQNYALLSDAQATAVGNIDNLNTVAGYLSSRNYAFAAKETIRLKVQPHIDSKSNPHGVTKAQVGLGNLPNALANNSATNDSATLATGKSLYDHARSGDHDDRYVRKNATGDANVKWEGGRVYIYGGGAWRQVWPAQWS